MKLKDKRMDLWQIYHSVYKHNVLSVTRDWRINHSDMLYLIKDVAKFGNMIATRPSARATSDMAESMHHDITYVHQDTISKMEKMFENVEPCICLRRYINNKVKSIERSIDDMHGSYNLEEDLDKLYLQYDYWLGKQVLIDEIYGKEDKDEETIQEDTEKTDSDDDN